MNGEWISLTSFEPSGDFGYIFYGLAHKSVGPTDSVEKSGILGPGTYVLFVKCDARTDLEVLSSSGKCSLTFTLTAAPPGSVPDPLPPAPPPPPDD